MERITEKRLESFVNHINKITNSPETTYTKIENGHFKANEGNFHLYQAYGASSLVRIANDGGGVTPIIPLCTKRELYNRMQAFVEGLRNK